MEQVSQPTETDQTEQTQSGEATQHCPECDSTALKTDQGERICTECGLVLDDLQLDHGPEWRAFTKAERDQKARVGAPTTQTIHDKGLTTQIDWKNQDASGRSLSSQKRSQLYRLRKWQERIRTQDAGERNLQFALSETDRMASALGVPKSVQEVSAVIYRRALTEDLIQGRSIEGVATACLYAACRQEGIPRSLDEVTTVSRVTHKEIARTYRYVVQELGLEIQPTDPKEYLPRFASQLDLPEPVVAKARDVVDTAAEQGCLSGNSPVGFAAGAIYAAGLLCNNKRTQREVADAANVTPVTIRKRYQEQLQAVHPES